MWIIASFLLSSFLLLASQVIDLNIELAAFHGPNWELIITAYKEQKRLDELKTILKSYILFPEKMHPNDTFSQNLYKSNAINGFGLIALDEEKHETIPSDDLAFYRKIIDNEFKNKESSSTDFLPAIYSSLKKNGSYQALELLLDLFNKEKELFDKMMIMQQASTLVDLGQSNSKKITRDMYGHDYRPNLQKPFFERGDYDWEEKISILKKYAHQLASAKFKKKSDQELFKGSVDRLKKYLNKLSFDFHKLQSERNNRRVDASDLDQNKNEVSRTIASNNVQSKKLSNNFSDLVKKEDANRTIASKEEQSVSFVELMFHFFKENYISILVVLLVMLSILKLIKYKNK